VDPDPQHWRTYLDNCVWEAHPTKILILGTLIPHLQFYVSERREETLQVTCFKHHFYRGMKQDLKFLNEPVHSLLIEILLEHSSVLSKYDQSDHCLLKT
jgi:hypothetical protein